LLSLDSMVSSEKIPILIENISFYAKTVLLYWQLPNKFIFIWTMKKLTPLRPLLLCGEYS